MLEKYSLSFEEFYKLSKYCKKKKIIFLSTPFDNLSAKFLNSIDTPAFKISSADLDNYHLLNFVKKFNKPIILSTGMSDQNKINKTLEFLNLSKSKLALMHCVSEYPTKILNSNLGFLSILKKKNLFFGVSDHTNDEIVPYVSCGLGIKLFEKHITLSKKFEGPDHIASLEAKNLKKFVKNIREIEFSLKNSYKKISKEESNNLKVVARKFFFSKKLMKNQQIKYNDIIPLRSDNKKGIEANFFLKIINKKLKKNVNKMEILTWQKIKKK